MLKLLILVRKLLGRQLTIIFIPHTTTQPVKKSFTISFLIFLLMFWTGLTIWSTYITSKHFDYCRLKIDREMLRFKLMFFAKELNKSQELLAQVKEKDEQLRALLNMKSKRAIVVSNMAVSGKGGPTLEEHKYLEKIIKNKVDELTIKDLFREARLFEKNAVEQLTSIDEINSNISYQRALYGSMPNRWPCTGNITSGYGYRYHPISGSYEFHTGIDIANSRSVQIYSTADGKVEYKGWSKGYGNLIILDHGYGYKTLYAHLSKILVKEHAKVKRGQAIGLMGDTGTSTGVHCHYEVMVNNRTSNPKQFFDDNHFFQVTKNLR